MNTRAERRVLERARAAEAQRRAIRRALRHLPQRLLAPIIGISRGSLRKFLAMSRPERETRARIQAWFEDQPEPETPAPAVALALLAAEFPASRRVAVRRSLVATLADQFERCGEQPPPWLIEEYRTAGRPPVRDPRPEVSR